jgi:hypothetical protein
LSLERSDARIEEKRHHSHPPLSPLTRRLAGAATIDSGALEGVEAGMPARQPFIATVNAVTAILPKKTRGIAFLCEKSGQKTYGFWFPTVSGNIAA